MAPEKTETAHRSLRRHILLGLLAAALLVGGLGTWAALTEISGAVIAHGLLVVESSVKTVQHPTGGVVGELLVRDGDHVKRGEVLVRLDETETRANLDIILRSIDELMARAARLEAEKVGAETLSFDPSLLDRKSDPVVAKLIDGESKLFELRRNARAGQKAQLRERIEQLKTEIEGLTEQSEAKDEEIALLEKELEGVRSLWERNLVQITRLTALERDAARLDGERGRLIASIAQARGKIAEVKLQIIQIDEDMRSEVAEELADGRATLAELNERKIAAEDRLRRVDIRSPQDGIVHQLQIHTVGGVVAPGDPIVQIVPEADRLIVEARISPTDIDQLRKGQKAMLHFSAFNLRTTPEIPGTVARIGADLSEDERNGARYYLVRVDIDKAALPQLGDLKLVPGMPVEVFMQTEPRTVLSFLVKPLRDQIMRTFREA
ncbi:HlyD family type I secretion periplasmic adaptor subunit [Methyloligella sp. 2.7D]|uniref:HlyD family type I secretion periplasmic adaptor subunit n=1 Tax=unclassified Methyloligella TaxID=2625955 RepID=UPI00157D113A|nr:HlyD family type I secretion periplasmic adaptor subunit [Methyloligella sp. GL2]QKP76702.1 HlyD family type I secretion periplasmic adaptor subunit [Methyloligella sp. GL2]